MIDAIDVIAIIASTVAIVGTVAASFLVILESTREKGSKN